MLEKWFGYLIVKQPPKNKLLQTNFTLGIFYYECINYIGRKACFSS